MRDSIGEQVGLCAHLLEIVLTANRCRVARLAEHKLAWESSENQSPQSSRWASWLWSWGKGNGRASLPSSYCLEFLPHLSLWWTASWSSRPKKPSPPSAALVRVFYHSKRDKSRAVSISNRSGLSLHELLSWCMFQFCKHHVEKAPFTECLAKMLKSRLPQSQEAHSALKAGDFAACLRGAPLYRVTSTGSLPPREDVR